MGPGTSPLEAILATAPSDGPLAPIPQVLLAVNLLEQGDAERASRLARTALQAGAGEPERGVAEGIYVDEAPDLLVRKMLALKQVELSHWVDHGMTTPHEELLDRLESQFVRAFCIPSSG